MADELNTNINNYSEESIDELSQIEGARFRPQSIGFESHSHIFTEQLANAIDEAREGYGNKIEVTKLEDNSIIVRDYGRSIPLDFNTKTQKYNWKTIFLTMWGGGKYSNNSKKANYKKSTGTNGAGNFGSATTSEFLEVWSYKGSECHNIRFEQGIVTKEFNKYEDNTIRGTKIHFKPDIKVYGENIIDDEFIESMMKRQSIINGGIKFTYDNKINKTIKEFYYENGIYDYIKEISKDKEFTLIYKFSGEVFMTSNPEDFEADYEIYFTFNNNTSFAEYYHNSSFLPNGGLPDKVIRSSMLDVFDKYLSNNNFYKKDEKIKFEDILDSLIIVFSSGSTTSIFTDQTKKSIGHGELQKHITNEFKSYLEILLTENKLEVNKIVNQILINMRSRNSAEKSRLNIKKKLQGEINIINKVEGLYESKVKDKNRNILCICEGKSALSAMLSGRQEIHAVFPLRGKILNCLKAPLDKILNNDIVLNLIKALGCGVEVKNNKKDVNIFDINNLRYSSVYIYVDADFDGMGSILPLLLTVFWKLTPTLVKEGRIYICETPKYEIALGDDFLYAVDDGELEELQKTLQEKKYKIHYIKGLSELSASTMAMCLDPNYKNITQVKLDDIEKSIQMLELFMGDKIEPRREYILNNF